MNEKSKLHSGRVRLAGLTAMFLLTVAALFYISASASIAEEESEPPKTSAEKAKKPVYQPAGAVADPKVEVHWNRYHDYAEATELLQNIAKTFPKLAKLESLGKSYGGRDMWAMTLTNFEKGKESEKPAFYIDGGIHANEIQAVEVPLYTAWFLAESYGRIPKVTQLLDERAFYIIPMVSPDSRDAHFYEPNTTHSPRSGQRPVDDDRDGLIDEDGPDDLDGDGSITQMRVRDPLGRFKPHPDYPDMMIPCKPGEKGEYTLLGAEGYDRDGDGRVNEDGDGFYDPNRDYPFNWQPPSAQYAAHHYPLSILENRMVADFIMAHPNIAGGQSYHNAGGMLLRAPGARNYALDAEDIRVYDGLGKIGEEILPGYRYINTSTELYEVHGCTVDFLFGMRGAFAFTNELFAPGNFFHDHADGAGIFGKPEKTQKFNKRLLFEDGISPWKEIDHPQFGKIEVGGMKKNWMRQPASFQLEEELHRNMAFTLFHADEMPKVEIVSLEARPLGGDLVQVTAAIYNPKRTPTHSAQDLKNKITPPNLVSLSGGDVEFVAAFVAENRIFDNPREAKLRDGKVRLANIPSEKPVYVRWIVRGKGPFTATVRSQKGGVASAECAIETNERK